MEQMPFYEHLYINGVQFQDAMCRSFLGSSQYDNSGNQSENMRRLCSASENRARESVAKKHKDFEPSINL